MAEKIPSSRHHLISSGAPVFLQRNLVTYGLATRRMGERNWTSRYYSRALDPKRTSPLIGSSAYSASPLTHGAWSSSFIRDALLWGVLTG